ncbi:O-antigen ligase domain-containing protein [Rhodopseudomonas palustris]|uniref:O-antigen ligase domain-containing protein n=1 Tax=Rhodopseudomonas palustris TaxID=1076 RepID=A0A323UKE1_RHOPL|nr:O-antigen ligase family protein [Rhodopseudomonas palustris]PZA12861.1 O-antigen ligase domain-containing protein [Rhodopseudomonas palustris]
MTDRISPIASVVDVDTKPPHAEVLGKISLGFSLATFALAPLPFGSVDNVWVLTWLVVLSLSLLGRPLRPVTRAQFHILLSFLAVCGAYGVVAATQIIPGLSVGANSISWERAGALVHLPISPRISARAEIPVTSVGHYLLLITSVLAGFWIGTSRGNSETLFKVARYSILLYALYGLLARAFTPGFILWQQKTAYQADLTATFINHNTAAALFGAGVILWICSVQHELKSLGPLSLRLLMLSPSNEAVGIQIATRAAAGLLCFFALLATGSRAGLACAVLGLFAAIVQLVAGQYRLRLAHGLLLAAVGLIVIALWLAQSQSVMTRGMFDEGRWTAYKYALRAIVESPMLGIGAGAFADVFPALRGSDMSMWGVWDYAHSTLVEIAVEMGLPIALLVWVSAVCSLAIVALAGKRSTGQSRTFLCAISGIMVMTYLHSLIDFPLQVPGYSIPFDILVGCGLALATRERREVRSPDLADAGHRTL